MINYENAKPSLFIEEELPSFIRNNGELFIDFLETYYDWLERKIVMLTVKSDFTIANTDIQIGELHSSSFFNLITENDELIVDENHDYSGLLDNEYSLYLEGTAGYMDIPNSIFTVSSSFSVNFFLQLNSLPSIARRDYDIITLSNSSYLSLLKISKASNTLRYNINGSEVDTNILIEADGWMFISFRYNSSTKTVYIDVINTSGSYSFTNSLDLSTTTSNRFVVGCDLYNSRNFCDIKIDEIGIWNKFLANNEVTAIYNDGVAINLKVNSGNYVSSTNLNNYFRLENNANNSITGGYNGTIYNDAIYTSDIPLNIASFITEDNLGTLRLKILSIVNYEGTVDQPSSDKMLLFAEHIYGKLRENDVLKNTDNGPILVSKFSEAKNPLSTINNLSNLQEIDYVLNYNNFIKNIYFQYMWKELMNNFPLFLTPNFEDTVKDSVAKHIKDFYRTKGTLLSFKVLFKLIYNEDLIIGTTVYANGPYEYTIKTGQYGSTEALSYIKSIVHPVGYKLNILPNT